MSFDKFRKKSISEDLGRSNAGGNPVGNLLRQMTLGIRILYDELDESNDWKRRLQYPPTTNSDGFLDLDQQRNPVLIQRRYLHERWIATGTFARIHLLNDEYLNRKVAIKIIKRECDVLAIREKAFVDHLSYVIKRGKSFFIQILEMIEYANHTCLVLPFYQGTLMDFVFDCNRAAFQEQSIHPSMASLSDHHSGNSRLRIPFASQYGERGDSRFGGHAGTNVFEPQPIRSSVLPTWTARQQTKSPLVPSSSVRNQGHQHQSHQPTRQLLSADLEIWKKIAIQLLSALWVLQREGIIHGDIKPENCFVSLPTHRNSSHHVSVKQEDSLAGNSRSTASYNHNQDSAIPTSTGISYSVPSRGGHEDRFSFTPQSQSTFPGQSSLHHSLEHGNSRRKGFTPAALLYSRDRGSHSINQSWDHPTPSASQAKFLRDLPVDMEAKLGDFGNALHLSELSQYYEDFELQSLPYRAPEVLLGLRNFSCAIDVWSLGIVLIELLIGQTLFHARDRDEAIAQVETTICKLSKTRFSSGKYAQSLFRVARLHGLGGGIHSPSPALLNQESSAWNRTEQTKALKRLLSKHVSLQELRTHELHGLIDFLTGLTAVDPSYRSTPLEALQHPFLVDSLVVPLPLLVQYARLAEDSAANSSGVYHAGSAGGGRSSILSPAHMHLTNGKGSTPSRNGGMLSLSGLKRKRSLNSGAQLFQSLNN